MKPVTVVTHVEKRPIAPDPPARPPLWMHLEDRESGVFLDADGQPRIRSCAPCPAVFVLKDHPGAVIGEQWQYYLRAINYAMLLENVYLLLDKALAFANGTGFRIDGDPRADWFHRRDLDRKPPNLDKVRTCSRNVLTGAPAYSLMTALQQTIAAAKGSLVSRQSFIAFRQSFRSLLIDQNVLKVTLFDSRQPPPLKPGRVYPLKIEDVRPDDYLYMPQTHPWMFAVANLVNRSGEVVQFPRGGLYAWTGDGTTRSFMPHIADLSAGDVLYPLRKLWRVPDDRPVPSPYRFA